MARGRWNGGIIGPNLKVTTSSASGIFTLSEAQVDVSAGLLPQVPQPVIIPPDSHFNTTTLLLHGDGSNGAQNNTFLDSSTNNFTITRTGTPSQGTFSPFSQTGWSNYFDGSSYLNGTFSPAVTLGTQDFTMEAWAYFTNFNYGTYGCPIISLYGNSGAAQFMLRANKTASSSTNMNILFYISGSYYPSGAGTSGYNFGTVYLNQWHHIAVTRASGVWNMYIDGTRIASVSDSSNLGTSASNFYIGNDHGSGDGYMGGYLSNVRFVLGTAVYTGATYTVPTSLLTAITNTSFLTCQSNRFLDTSSNNYSLTVNSTPSVQPFSPFAPAAAYGVSSVGGSAYFNGSTDYLSTPATSALNFSSNNFTVELWVNFSAITSYQCFLIQLADSAHYYNFNFGNGSSIGLNLTYNSGGSQTIVASQGSQGSYVTGVWYHVAYVRNGTTVTIYLNGSSVATGTLSGALYFPNATTYIGQSGLSSGYVSGYISNLRVLNGTALYTTTFTPPTAPVTAIANTQLLLNGTNAAIYDSTARSDVITTGSAQISTSQSQYGGSSIYFVKSNATDGLLLPASPLWAFGTGDFTVEFWLKTSTTASNVIWVTGGWAVVIVSGNTYWQTVQGSSSLFYVATGSINNNSWHHFAVTRASGTIRMYLDGALYATYGSTDSTNYNAVAQLNIGYNGSYGWYDGYLDDIRITKGYARYSGASSFTPPTASFANQ
jgi:Concanavalin A-like lectin/glucanases superfamily